MRSAGNGLGFYDERATSLGCTGLLGASEGMQQSEEQYRAVEAMVGVWREFEVGARGFYGSGV